eukprot:scaffold320939_cov22-Tisochrysis_lutea.AAC.1
MSCSHQSHHSAIGALPLFASPSAPSPLCGNPHVHNQLASWASKREKGKLAKRKKKQPNSVPVVRPQHAAADCTRLARMRITPSKEDRAR